MKTQTKNILLVVGILVLLISACGPLGSESTPVVAPEPIVEVINEPTAVPTETVVEEPVLPAVSNYVGMIYPPLPFGFLEGFHLLIQDSPEYELTLIADGGRRMLWLSKISQTDANGNLIWEVKDVLDFSGLEPGLTLLPDGCFLNGEPDSEIFAAGRNGVIVLAWRADTILGVFEVLSTTGIQCNSDKAVGIS